MSHSTALGQVLRFLPTRCLTSPAPASSDWKQDMGSWGPEKSLGGRCWGPGCESFTIIPGRSQKEKKEKEI